MTSPQISRRKVARSAAWAVPAVALTSAAPSASASTPAVVPCTATTPDAGFINNGTVSSSTYTQIKPSLKGTCAGMTLPAGYVVTVSLTNNGTGSEQYKTNTSSAYVTTGPTSYTAIGAGQTRTWTYTTTQAIPAGSSLGMFALTTNGNWTATWTITTVPAGYTDPDASNNSITINANT